MLNLVVFEVFYKRFSAVTKTGVPDMRTRLLSYNNFVVLAFLILSLAGITGSSIGVGMLSETSEARVSKLLKIEPKSIRSDEFLRVTPWRLGLFKNGNSDFGSPLSSKPSPLVITTEGDFLTSLINIDNTVGRAFGKFSPAIGLASMWWFPIALVFLALPVWTSLLGFSRLPGYLAAVLIVLSPASVWWSFGPTTVVSFAVGAGVFLGKAQSMPTNSFKFWLYNFGFGLFVVRLIFSYFPWALPLGLLFITPFLFVSRSQSGMLVSIRRIGYSASIACSILIAYIFLHFQEIQSLSSTVYPGQRRLPGQMISFGQLFGAPFLGYLNHNPSLVGTNESEISGSFLFLLVPAIFIYSKIKPVANSQQARVIKFLLAIQILLLFWVSLDWPSISNRFFPMNLVPSGRLAAIIGFFAIIIFVLSFSIYSVNSKNEFFPILILGCCNFLVLGHSGTVLESINIPSLTTRAIWSISLAISILLIAMLRYPKSKILLFGLTLLLCWSSLFVNPVQSGAKNLTSSKIAVMFTEINSSSQGRRLWASDSIQVDAVLMANGIESLSGQQWVGPNREAWMRLDASKSSEKAWNRGQSYLEFAWDGNLETIKIENPSPDQIRVTISPCNSSLNFLDLKMIVSSSELNLSCLKKVNSTFFSGQLQNIYERQAP